MPGGRRQGICWGTRLFTSTGPLGVPGRPQGHLAALLGLLVLESWGRGRKWGQKMGQQATEQPTCPQSRPISSQATRVQG